MSFLVLKYQGQEISRDIDRKVYRETWIGDSASIDGVISGLTIGTLTQGKGYLRAWTKKQDEGEHYTAELEYSETFTSDFSDESGTTVGKRSATLSTRTVQLPIEKATGYKTNWNYYLISTLQLSPLWWTTATNTIIPVADRKNYMWIKNLSEMPIEANANGQYWNVCAEPTKPGV